MADKTEKCPMCAETIQAEADEEGKGINCGNPVFDLRLEIRLVEEPKAALAFASAIGWISNP